MANTALNTITALDCNDLGASASLGTTSALVIASTLASTAIVHANTHSVAFPKNDSMLLRIKNTTAGEKAFTLKAGDKIGGADTVLTIAQDQEIFVNPDASKYKDEDGNLVITVASSTTGNISAIAF